MVDEAETPIETGPEASVTVAVPAEPAALEDVPAVEAVAETPTVPAKSGRKPKAQTAAAIAPMEITPVAAFGPVMAAPAQLAPRRRKALIKAAAAEAASAKAAPVRPSVVRSAIKPARKIAVAKAPVFKPALHKALAPAASAKIDTVTTSKNLIVGFATLSQLKDTLMDKIIPTDFAANVQTAFSDIQDKAKTAYEKSTEVFGEANDFAKGNVEALVESGKLLASGLQELGSTVVADSKSAFETITADVKELAAVKSPTEFFQLQSALIRKSFDGAVAQASKNTEAMMKLATEAFTPISSRVSLAVEKVSKVA